MEDENGWPRCRNYTGETLEQVIGCISTLGTGGCGFEQSLEAMYKALNPSNTANDGFMRDSARLGVFFLTDEDDCSTKNSELFNPEGGLSDALGPLTDFRCTEFGVTCDQEWERVMPSGTATYTGCHSRPDTDPRSMLYPVSRYENFLRQLKNSDEIIVGSIAGPNDKPLTVSVDEDQYPQLDVTCGTARPAVRLQELVTAMTAASEVSSLSSICASDFDDALGDLGERLPVPSQGPFCLPLVAAGCPDPAAAAGATPLTSLPAEKAESCVPDCRVSAQDLEYLVYADIPPCPADYAGGRPDPVDPDLPVEMCFYIGYEPVCSARARKGAVKIASRGPLEGNLFVYCPYLPNSEYNCSDGVDNDQDGLVDGQDPDCRP